jgi:colanic acid/amylovoran biosynthesis glycosyltransferase
MLENVYLDRSSDILTDGPIDQQNPPEALLATSLKTHFKSPIKIAYLVNRYPAITHSFIRREILALERLGNEILRISIRGWSEQQRDERDQQEQLRTRYVLRDGAFPLIEAFLRTAIRNPLRLAKTIMLLLRIGWRTDRPLHVHFIYLFEACRILQWLKTENVQHLHAHFGTNSAEVAMLVHELGGPRWSFTVHGPEEFDKARFIALSEKIRRAVFVVAISSFGRGQLLRNIPHDQWSKVRVVHCGIEPDFWANSVRAPGTPRLVCVGRLCEQKGQMLLIESMRRLFDRGTRFDLVIAGDGEMRGELEELVDRYKLRSHVRITGWVNGNQVKEEISAARALVLPSFSEGLPVVLMEAMALGRPVISTFVAGIPELVKSGEEGWLVPAGDVAALSDAIEKCLGASPDVIADMGERARTRALQRHDVSKEATTLDEMFRAAIDEGRRLHAKSHRRPVPALVEKPRWYPNMLFPRSRPANDEAISTEAAPTG